MFLTVRDFDDNGISGLERRVFLVVGGNRELEFISLVIFDLLRYFNLHDVPNLEIAFHVV